MGSSAALHHDADGIVGGTMVQIPLDDMSVEEKLQAMESIWDDLCRRAGGVPSPPWHERELPLREEAAQRGEDSF
tara:strand:- start:269 stop:493 length:225 start_codon:yes stop_codon:yes gene_type:complete